MKFHGGVRDGTRNKLLKLGGHVDHHADCLTRNSVQYSTNYEQILMKISGELCNDTKNNCVNFWDDLDHHADTPDHESKQYWGNEVPCQRPTLLSACSCSPIGNVF